MKKEIDTAAGKIIELLDCAVKKTCTERTGIMFSAGIDSTLVAQLAARHSDITAYNVGIPDSPDARHAGNEELDFKIKTIRITPDDIESAIAEVMKVVREPNPVKVGVGIPVYFASKAAAGDGLKVILCGQGADELFGGYNRYLEMIAAGGYGEFEKAMKSDIRGMYEDNLNRDIEICKNNAVELRIPYADKDFIDYAMGIPPGLKIVEVTRTKPEFSCVDEINGRRFIRKYILRKAAERLGMPKEILNRSKKAAQYGSGANKVIEKIARDKGFKKKAAEVGRGDYVRMFLEDITP
ncbi:MAG: hypothetical protein MSIBF_03140 [Candidatus Altiarchaeales archaeon IMC4]|nr:MAG: hypothetical protein MSIBF_03140 [Candidatus Altiarchaeales archaeon IMC4]